MFYAGVLAGALLIPSSKLTTTADRVRFAAVYAHDKLVTIDKAAWLFAAPVHRVTAEWRSLYPNEEPMGETTTPSPADRAKRRATARTIIESVRNDEEMRLGLSIGRSPSGVRTVALVDAQQLAFELAQEIEMLRDELAAVDDVIGDYDWAAVAEDAHGTDFAAPLAKVARIEAARKEARRG
jgi:hypothetical protein